MQEGGRGERVKDEEKKRKVVWEEERPERKTWLWKKEGKKSGNERS